MPSQSIGSVVASRDSARARKARFSHPGRRRAVVQLTAHTDVLLAPTVSASRRSQREGAGDAAASGDGFRGG